MRAMIASEVAGREGKKDSIARLRREYAGRRVESVRCGKVQNRFLKE